MTMVIKKPKAKKTDGNKSDVKYMDINKVNPKYRDALLILFSLALMIGSITLFVVLIRQPTPDPDAKNSKLHRRTPVRPEVKVHPRAGD